MTTNVRELMAEALERAEKWFRDYERQHRAKGTSEGNLKADTNEERADYLRTAITAYRQESGDGWQPIESAPRDGTPVLVFAPGTSDRWEGDLGDLICACPWHPDAGFCVCELREPTHWQPLPPAPAPIHPQGEAFGLSQGTEAWPDRPKPEDEGAAG